MMGLLGLARVTDQKLRVFDRSQFVALAGFDFGERLFRTFGGNFDEGLFCLNAFDGYEGWHGFKWIRFEIACTCGFACIFRREKLTRSCGS